MGSATCETQNPPREQVVIPVQSICSKREREESKIDGEREIRQRERERRESREREFTAVSA